MVAAKVASTIFPENPQTARAIDDVSLPSTLDRHDLLLQSHNRSTIADIRDSSRVPAPASKLQASADDNRELFALIKASREIALDGKSFARIAQDSGRRFVQRIQEDPRLRLLSGGRRSE